MRRFDVRRLLLAAVSPVGLLGGALIAPSTASAAVEYVKVCTLYGAGFYYIPGTDRCADGSAPGFRVATEYGVLRNSAGTTYGVNGFTGEATGNSAFGKGAWAGGDPNGDIPMRKPLAVDDPDYDADEAEYALLYAANGGFWPRDETLPQEPLPPPGDPDYDPDNDPDYLAYYNANGGLTPLTYVRPSSKFPYSSFANENATAIGLNAMAGAGADGQDNATAVGAGAVANALNATAIGQGAQANVEDAVALGQGSVADVAGTVSVGASGAERKIVNVAAGAVSAASTEAVTGSQLHAASSDVAAALGGGAAVSATGEWTAPAYTVQGDDYDNVGGALGALDTQVTANTDAISDLQDDVTAHGTAIGALQDDVGDLQDEVQAHGEAIDDLQDGVAANGAALATAQDDITGLQGDMADVQDDVSGLQDDVAGVQAGVSDIEDGLADGTIGLVQQDPVGRGLTVGVSTDGDTVGFAGTDGERRLTGVAAGVDGTDVVNLAQMQDAIANIAAQGAQFGDAPDGMDGPTADGEGSYAAGYGANADGDDTTALGTGAEASFEGATAIGAGARATADPTTAVGFFAEATGNNASAFGGNASATAENATAIGESSQAIAIGATALGRGAIASAANSVALGAGSLASRGAQADYAALGLADPQTSAGEVSVGVSGGARQITNVAPGSAGTDAVNVDQLAGVRAEALAYTDLASAVFSQSLANVQRRADAGTAAALATAGLVQATTPGSSMVSGGVGAWRGASALAFGVSHRFDGAWTVKAAGTVAERGGAGMNASVGFEF